MEFWLDLDEEQTDLRDWVHGFAEGVIRPAASEWDEREETPWPILQEAAKIGLYGFEFLVNTWSDTSPKHCGTHSTIWSGVPDP